MKTGTGKIALFPFASPLHEDTRLLLGARPLLDVLDRHFTTIRVRPGEGFQADLAVVFIASGGVEEPFRAAAPLLPRPLILLTDGRHNSLAASLEIMSWLRRQGERGRLLHGDLQTLVMQLQELISFERCRTILAGRIGIIGTPSDWLVGSAVDTEGASRHWGSTFIPVDISELIAQVGKEDRTTALDLARETMESASAMMGLNREDLIHAFQVYPALKGLYEKYGLVAATVRCFSLLESLGTTGCPAVSRLNDEGFICGCEGDVAALFSMLLLHGLTGGTAFMANPARIDLPAGELILAHCTIPLGIVDGFRLRSHFESGIGVGIDGDLPLGPATLFKLGGPFLDEYFVTKAEIKVCERDENMCRTQVCLGVDRDALDYFFNSPLANHHLLLVGDHADLIRRFMAHCACRAVG